MDKGVYYIKNYTNGSSTNRLTYEDPVHIVANKVETNGDGKLEDSKVNFIVLDDDEGNHASFNVGGAATSCTNIFSHRKVTLTGDVVLRGAVIANEISVTAGASIEYYPGKGCNSDAIDDDEYTLTMDTDDYYALLCEDPGLNITLTVKNGEHIAYDYNDTIDVTVKSLSSPSYPIKGDVTGNYRPVNGQLTLKLTSQGSQDVEVIAQLNPKGNSHSVSATYHFVPYKFAAEDQYVIANKPENVAVKVLGCDTDDKVIDIGYNGQPTVTSEWQAPLNGVGNVTFSPNFNAGNVTADSQKLVMEESGIRTVTMTDANFDCSDPKYNCPIEGKGKLQGSFTVYSRPWTFAICSSDTTDITTATGTSQDGPGFMAAGERFALHILPIKWQDGAVSGEIETNDDWCSISNITTNFFLEDGLNNNISLDSEIDSPASSNAEILLSSAHSLTLERHQSSTYYPFTDLFWNDVGSLKVMSATENHLSDCESVTGLQAWYECTQIGYRNIGRFYPAYFDITQSTWSLSGQSGIAYLSQPYDSAEFIVTPYALGDTPVQNYHQFDSSLQATFSLLEDADKAGRLLLDLSSGNWIGDNGHSQWYLDDSNAVFQRAYQASLESGHQVSIVDGPYNTSDSGASSTAFGFTVTAAVDPVDSRSESQCSEGCHSLDLTFPNQPPARYGRMRLMDVGGTSVEPIAVPLRVEFWQGSRFVTNTQDNDSTFSTDENLICKQMIWSYSDKASLSKLSGAAGQVAQGESSAIKAEPSSDTENIREQVRFWLRLDDGDTNDDSQQRSAQVGETSIECPSGYLKQPWLRYNWRAKGDEDPSAVVTFGIFRGNDRVIFRGEPGLTGH
ncbi:hypothetical protein EXA18_12720 [Vibrio cincinnatiensis]|nr:DUF6701 domain-containing protein [Vibrio cincinnatiensis]MCG3744339.1 hypothetical protein [Vibrio cincinnatiensis]